MGGVEKRCPGGTVQTKLTKEAMPRAQSHQFWSTSLLSFALEKEKEAAFYKLSHKQIYLKIWVSFRYL